jgi:hypothetical protein
MVYDLFIKRRIDEIEEKLLKYTDNIERLHIWFVFIKDFTMEAHTLLDAQYGELVQLCKVYTATPDIIARNALRKQVIECSFEIECLNSQLKRIPKIQSKLERDITGMSPTGMEYGS